MKKALLLALLVSSVGYSQDHFSGITTSKRVGILNIGLNPSELANLNNHLENDFFQLQQFYMMFFQYVVLFCLLHKTFLSY